MCLEYLLVFGIFFRSGIGSVLDPISVSKGGNIKARFCLVGLRCKLVGKINRPNFD